MKRRVVVTGLGAVTPLGVGVDALWDGWTGGQVAIEDGAGRCADFAPADAMDRKLVRRTDRYTQLAIAAAVEAVAQAGWGDDLPYEPERVACVLGTGVGGITTIEGEYEKLGTRGVDAVSPMTVPMMMVNAAPAHIAMRFGLRGPAFTAASACAAGAHAIGTAMRMIQVGDCDAVVTGGAEAPFSRLSVIAFANMEATSPTGRSRPFERRRDGFVMGEGAGVLVLEDAEAAARRGAHVLAELVGYASTDDAFHITAPEPHGEIAARAVELALRDGGVTPSDVSYVNAHGTSTPLNDRTETLALKHALGEDVYRVPVSSLKSSIGHLIGGAGGVEAVATAEALRRRVVPPTLGYEEPDPELDLDYVPNVPRPMVVADGARAIGLSNSFGFGGHNVVLCLAEAA